MTTAAATAYPLCWPDHIPRSSKREAGQFKTTLAGALNNVRDSLRLFGKDSGRALSDIILSSNVTLGAERPEDPGVAVWFTWDGVQVCIPVDRYASAAANLQAIHHIIEARRVELRHGTLALVRASFRGFQALPNPNSKNRPWRAVLGDVKTTADVDATFRRLAAEKHPDKGGSHADMAELTAAREQAKRELGA